MPGLVRIVGVGRIVDGGAGRTRGSGAAGGGIRVAIVDDHALFRDGLIFTVTERGGHRVVAACHDLAHLYEFLAAIPEQVHPQVVLLDLLLDGELVEPSDVENLLRRGIRVLIVSGTRNGPRLQALLRAGAAGYVAKEDSSRELLAAIEAAATGNAWTSRELAEIVANDPQRPALSDRELEAVTLYARGLTMASVARRMGVSYETARQYVDRARRKWAAVGREARTKTQLYEAARQDGLLGPSS